MPNEIRAEHGASTALTITLSSLASSTGGAGRQSDIVNNVDNAQIIHLYLQVRMGTSPNADTNVYVYLIKSDGTLRSDGAGASDANLTVKNARLIGVMRNTGTTSNVDIFGEFTIRNPGPEWGIVVVQDTGSNLNASGHDVNFTTENQEVQ